MKSVFENENKFYIVFNVFSAAAYFQFENVYFEFSNSLKI